MVGMGHVGACCRLQLGTMVGLGFGQCSPASVGMVLGGVRWLALGPVASEDLALVLECGHVWSL